MVILTHEYTPFQVRPEETFVRRHLQFSSLGIPCSLLRPVRPS